MLAAGKSRREIARTLNTAYANGLLSEETFLHRVDQLLIGRDLDCDVVLTDVATSRFHAWLKFRDGRWILQDLDSTNGTSVNGEPVGRSVLRAGDVISIGTQRLTID